MWFLLSIVLIVSAVFVGILIFQGLAFFTFAAYLILKLLGKIIGVVLMPPTEPEIVGQPLTDEFKSGAKGQLAPDMWTDGRRIYFEVGAHSYSVPADLELARRRKNELLKQMV